MVVKIELTHRSNNLRLHAELVAESAGEVRHAASSIAGYVGYFSDVVEHVAACEKEDGDQADRSPEISVLDHR